MFSYYGSKAKIARLYPAPTHKVIIEPFAGAAWYSVLHRSHNVLLNEKYSTLFNIWHWLINEATQEVILKNREFYLGQNIRTCNIAKSHQDLIGFLINRGSSTPKVTVPQWSCQVKSNPYFASTPYYALTQIAKMLPEIKHWGITLGDYRELPDVEATWFIDPPYQYGGEYYVVNDINYHELAEWCKQRKGQVIVCENTKASWLDFVPLTKITGQRVKTTEAVWTREA